MPAVRPRQHRPALRAALVVVASLVTAVAVPPATAYAPPVLAAPVPVVTVEAAPQRVSAAPEVRVAVSSPVASVVAPAAPAGERWEVVGAQATARLLAAGIDPADLGYTVDYLPGRSGLRGLTLPSRHRIEMYVRSSHDVEDVLRVLVHELGHAVSETCLDSSDRATYDAVRGLRTGWYPSVHSGASGTEDHAEVFAWSVLGALPDMKPTGGGAPTADELTTLRAAGLLSTC